MVKLHNTILVGMIPGPREPPNLNPFLEPLVSDLNRLYKGIYVNSPAGIVKICAILSGFKICCTVYVSFKGPATRYLAILDVRAALALTGKFS